MNKSLLIILFCLLLSVSLSAQITLSPFQSSWRYLDNGTNQGAEWRKTGFNDGSWKTGNGKFGYGISDANTRISFGPDSRKKYITTYFRTTVSLDPSVYPNFTGRIKRDDGVIVYVNGVEVYRNNMPSGTVSYTTLASVSATDNGMQEQVFSISSSYFVAGANTIAVEIHQYRNNNGDTDMAFDFSLGSPELTPPVVSSSNRQVPLSYHTAAEAVTFRVTFSEPVTGVDVTDFLVAVTGDVATNPVPLSAVAAGNSGAAYDVTVNGITGTAGQLRLDLKSEGTGIKDLNWNAIATGFTGGEYYYIDRMAPSVLSILRHSPTTEETSESTLVYRINFSEPVHRLDSNDFILSLTGSASGTIAGNAVRLASTDSTAYDVTVSSVAGNGTIQLYIDTADQNIADRAGNLLQNPQVIPEKYTISSANPYVVSILRNAPENATAGSVTYRVTFSEPVSGVDYKDFMATATTGTIRGTLADLANEASGTTGSSAVKAASADGTTYDVTVRALSGSGTLRLDLQPQGTGIMVASANAISGGFTSGESYSIEVAVPGFATIADINPVTVSAHTGEKPQAKVWTHAGKWWTVLATASGTKIFRLDGMAWTDVLTIVSSTNAKADCIVKGDLVHILLFRGTSNSYIVSVQYNPATGLYELWSQRTTRATILFEPGSKTATMSLDGQNRLWIANDGVGVMYVRWSDAPYSTWSAPLAVASGATDDDICAIVALPGKTGLMWSNQNTQRFGFITHADGADPSVWSADEVPASQSALAVRFGMADDHISVIAASDGTLYCAVKTGYDTPGYAKVSLLVRRPSGSWDPLYPVTSNEGTRPVVVLNESSGKVKVVYTSLEAGGDILYRESSITNISFGYPYTLKGGNPAILYNYSTTTHQTYSSGIVILFTELGADGNRVRGILATDAQMLQAAAPSRRKMEAPDKIQDAVMENYPNPFSTATVARFRLPVSGQYSVHLFNSNGILIATLQKGTGTRGQWQQVTINGSALAAGMYVLRLQTALGIRTIKLVKQ